MAPRQHGKNGEDTSTMISSFGEIMPENYGPMPTRTMPANCIPHGWYGGSYGSHGGHNDLNETLESRDSLDSFCTYKALNEYFGDSLDSFLSGCTSGLCYGDNFWDPANIEGSNKENETHLDANPQTDRIALTPLPRPEGEHLTEKIDKLLMLLKNKDSPLVLLKDREPPVKKEMQQKALFHDIVKFLSSAEAKKALPNETVVKQRNDEMEDVMKESVLSSARDDCNKDSASSIAGMIFKMIRDAKSPSSFGTQSTRLSTSRSEELEESVTHLGDSESIAEYNIGASLSSVLASESQPLGGPKYYVATITKAGLVRVIHEAMPTNDVNCEAVAEEMGYEIIEHSLVTPRMEGEPPSSSSSPKEEPSSSGWLCDMLGTNDDELARVIHEAMPTNDVDCQALADEMGYDFFEQSLVTPRMEEESPSFSSSPKEEPSSSGWFLDMLGANDSYDTGMTERTYDSATTGSTKGTYEYKKDFSLCTLENEVVNQDEEIKILSKSLEQHRKSQELHSREKIKNLENENELKATNAQLNSCVAEKDALLLELENTKGALYVFEEKQKKAEDQLAKAIAQTVEQLSTSHAKDIGNLITQLEASASSEIQLVRVEAEEQRESAVEPTTNQMKDSQVADGEKVRLDVIKMANNSHSEQLDQLTASHEEEMVRGRSDMDASASQMLTRQKQMELIQEKMNSCVSDKDALIKESKGTEEDLQISDEQKKAEVQLDQVLSGQKEIESIEDQINPSVSNNDELENTSLLKELEKTTEALSKSEEKHARVDMQLVELALQQKQMDYIEDQFDSCVSDKAALLIELKNTQEALSSSEENNAKAEMQLAQMLSEPKQVKYIQETKVVELKQDKESIPQTPDTKETDASALPKATSLVVDTSIKETNAPSGMVETPPSARPSSSKLFEFKQRYHQQRHRKLFREFPKTADNAKPTMTKKSQEMPQDTKQDKAADVTRRPTRRPLKALNLAKIFAD